MANLLPTKYSLLVCVCVAFFVIFAGIVVLPSYEIITLKSR